MKYTFEIFVAGCNTNCLHCYVDGGPAPFMPYADYLFCLERLKPLLQSLEGDISLTLGNELANHPQAKEIILTTLEFLPEYYSHQETGITTTALALLARPDKDEIIEAYIKAGATNACLTIHGKEEHHNEIVKNQKAFAGIIKAANYFSSLHLDLLLAIVLSKYMVEDWNALLKMLGTIPYSKAFIVIPLYLPLERLGRYQSIRAEYSDCLALCGRLQETGIDEERFLEQIERFSEKAIANRLSKGFDYKLADSLSPKWIFLNIDRELNLYYGNGGAPTKHLGNLRHSTTEELLERILALSPNYDYSAYYDLNLLPPIGDILAKISPLKTNYVYPDLATCIYSWFNLADIPSLILK